MTRQINSDTMIIRWNILYIEETTYLDTVIIQCLLTLTIGIHVSLLEESP
jgi:hypothetical protein